jgi:hypothetical protein
MNSLHHICVDTIPHGLRSSTLLTIKYYDMYVAFYDPYFRKSLFSAPTDPRTDIEFLAAL